MPNVYISLGVHGFFRDAPTTLNIAPCFSCILLNFKQMEVLCSAKPYKMWFSRSLHYNVVCVGDKVS